MTAVTSFHILSRLFGHGAKGSWAKRSWAKSSTVLSKFQKCRAERTFEAFSAAVASFSALRGSCAATKRLKACRAPMPTSQLSFKSCFSGYAMSTLIISIFAQVSPKP